MSLSVIKPDMDVTRRFNCILCRKIAPLWAAHGTLSSAYWSDILIDAACLARDAEGEKTIMIVRDLGTNTTTDMDKARDLIARNDWTPLAVWIVTRASHDQLLFEDVRYALI